MTDIDAINFFRDGAMVVDPFPYFDAMRQACPVRREPHHGVTDVPALIAQHRGDLPMSDQLPAFDPPAHTAHRALLMRLITPKRLKENEAFMRRLADQQVDTMVGGVEIPAGTTVMVLNAAANRDPRRFDAPAVFRADRANARRHIAFGRGIHTCPGAPLARTEARVSVERILDRTRNIRLDEDKHGPAGAWHFRYVPTYILRGLTRLYLKCTPADSTHGEAR